MAAGRRDARRWEIALMAHGAAVSSARVRVMSAVSVVPQSDPISTALPSHDGRLH